MLGPCERRPPVEVFIVEGANVNVLTSLLFSQKEAAQAIQQRTSPIRRRTTPIFMAVADRVGFDRRGNTLFKRGPDGEEILVDKK
jgi:type I restriction enzyme M protein